MATDTDIAQADLAELLNVLGMGDHARPQSPHEVFQEALGVLRRRLGEAQHWSDCAVHNEPAMPAGPCNCGEFELPEGYCTLGLAPIASEDGHALA